MSEKKPDIENRKSWLLIFVIVTVTVLFAYKLLITPINVDFSQFNFSDFLALILSLFAIGMSVAFYLKASETSNEFYNNSYTFTKNISEILGRIEAGFGERLRHLDEGYSGLRDHFERSPLGAKENEKIIKIEQEKYEEKLKEQKKLIESLTSRVQLEEKEKNKLINDIRKREIELNETSNEIKFLKQRSELLQHMQNPSPIPIHIREYILSTVIPSLGGASELSKMTSNSIMHRFNNIKIGYPTGFLEQMKILRLLDSDGNLRIIGARKIKNLAHNVLVHSHNKNGDNNENAEEYLRDRECDSNN